MSLFTVCLRTIAGFYAVACEVLPCSSLETVSWELPQLSWVTSRSLTHDTMYYVSCLFCLVSARVDCEFLLRPSNHAATHDYLGRCNLR